ncbi:MAG TPA: NRDE family protein [Rhodocyclaceae bacterium]|jgi:uncharacterized protein with NRDE domain|nr:NRDE family protein [Betaproteobacteria bacterium]HMV00854.1 NRDE family protein [Rhodocyclaceae bacterium]HMV19900.1 NRDE family protein [Rhodocyclaceae bacterium]HNL21081.1 NRDE family protein [Rhodocyclaceae bacterium]HNM79888.1 NRDE family protein [Rhodocyclaceae bacterium]
MCLILVAWRQHPQYPLVVAANRDEYHSRPSAPAAPWQEDIRVIGGKDLEAGGTWLALRSGGRFAAVTNVREPGVAKGNRSRGLLVSDYLLCGSAPLHYCRKLEGGDYSGFNFLAADTTALVYYSNRNGSPEVLPPGIYGVSNHFLDTPWPKLTAAKAAFTEALAALPIRDDCFALLADRAIAPDTRLPATGVSLEWERRLSAIFVLSPDYGTRTSSVAWITASGEALLEERNFFPDGSRGQTSLISTAE